MQLAFCGGRGGGGGVLLWVYFGVLTLGTF